MSVNGPDDRHRARDTAVPERPAVILAAFDPRDETVLDSGDDHVRDVMPWQIRGNVHLNLDSRVRHGTLDQDGRTEVGFRQAGGPGDGARNRCAVASDFLKFAIDDRLRHVDASRVKGSRLILRLPRRQAW